ncbi:FIST signal transduction protein [Haloechinothrix halophila]|uniref:FIST signal transduction protein n=1 Tax=Haloechinothrix halophila TaxID=1069073 RepID=UPI00041B9F34|nr:FIST N-terminal domain-containing protein [Haloechinothrix halophila]
MRIGVGVSTVRDPSEAASEATTTALAGLNDEPATFAVLLTSPEYRDDAMDVLAAVHDTAAPDALIGCVAETVVANARELEGEPSVAVWLASSAERVETFHLEFVRTPSGGLFAGYEFGHANDDFHLLLPDPYSFPADVLLDHLNAHRPGVRIMGGMVSGGGGPGGCRLFRDGDVVDSGAVGVRLPGWRGLTVVSQGCRPIGEPYTVTGSSGTVLTGLGGRPPLDRLRESIAALPDDQRDAAERGPQIGILVDEYVDDPQRGDFLVRAILGADQESGAIQVGDAVEVGTTVRFQVRDAASAEEDLRERLRNVIAETPRRPAGALLFTCNGRGSRMFDVADHDAALIADSLGGIPMAGFFAAGELGPVAGRNALHGFTASLALFVSE